MINDDNHKIFGWASVQYQRIKFSQFDNQIFAIQIKFSEKLFSHKKCNQTDD